MRRKKFHVLRPKDAGPQSAKASMFSKVARRVLCLSIDTLEDREEVKVRSFGSARLTTSLGSSSITHSRKL